MAHCVAISTSSFAGEDRAPLELLEGAGVTIKPNPHRRRLTEAEIIRHLEDADGLLAGLEPLNRRVLASSGKLKAIARVGIGMDNVDLDAARELGIKVSNTPDGPTRAVAEMTLAAMLSLCRGLPAANAALHAGEWRKSIGAGLVGTHVLIVGYGRIGRRVAGLLHAFGAEVFVADPFIEPSSLGAGERMVTLEEGLSRAQVVTLHAAGDQVVIGEREFALARDGMILLNSARGGLVDEAALLKALDSGKVRAAWCDAFREEPYAGPLMNYEQVLLTPHISTYTRQCRLSMAMAAVQNLLRDLGIASPPKGKGDGA